MKTANGIIVSETQATVPIPELEQNAITRVYKNTPALMSIGEGCMKHNFGFHWEPGEKPYIVLPSKEVVGLEVVNFVPILVSKGSAKITTKFDMAAAVQKMHSPSLACACDSSSSNTHLDSEELEASGSLPA